MAAEPPIPMAATLASLSGGPWQQSDEKLIGPPAQWSELIGTRYAIEVVAHYLSILENQQTIEAYISAGRHATVHVLLEHAGLLYHYAERTMEVHAPDAVRSLHSAAKLLEIVFPGMHAEFRPLALSLYFRASRLLHQMVFGSGPAIGKQLVAQRLQTSIGGPVVNVAIIVVGAEVGRVAQVTLNTLVYHSTSVLRLFVLGDRDGWGALRATASPRVRSVLADAVFVDLEGSARFAAVFGALPQACPVGVKRRPGSKLQVPNETQANTTQAQRRALVARAFLHELLPALDRVVALDAGDFLLFSDVRHLWDMMDQFVGQQFFAAAIEVGPTQISYAHDSTGAVAAFWRRRGAPSADRGFNAGVLLFDFERMRRQRFSAGENWTQALVEGAWHMNRHYCGHELMEQAILSAFVFHGGEQFWFEIPSSWNYIPNVPWEQATVDASFASHAQAAVRKLHPGLLPGGRLTHACPGYAELLAEWTWGEPAERRDWWVGHARSYFRWFRDLGAPGWYTRDLKCGAYVHAVHLAGYLKLLPWARKLVKFWLDGPRDGGFFEEP